MLTNIILEKNGVKAIIKAVIEVDSHSSIHWSHCTVVAKLISTTCCERTEDYIRLFVPQVFFSLVYSKLIILCENLRFLFIF